MIRQIRGKLLAIGMTGVEVEVAGFGLHIFTTSPPSTLIGSEITLATHLAVKQDGMDLYGFIDPADRDFFEILLTVSGVGPKTALGVLRKTPREQMQGALARRDLSYLTRVAGLSRKSAEKMMAELSEKLESKKDGGNDEDAEVFETLLALGYTEREARKALGTLPDALLGKEARLRAALSNGR